MKNQQTTVTPQDHRTKLLLIGPFLLSVDFMLSLVMQDNYRSEIVEKKTYRVAQWCTTG